MGLGDIAVHRVLRIEPRSQHPSVLLEVTDGLRQECLLLLLAELVLEVQDPEIVVGAVIGRVGRSDLQVDVPRLLVLPQGLVRVGQVELRTDETRGEAVGHHELLGRLGIVPRPVVDQPQVVVGLGEIRTKLNHQLIRAHLLAHVLRCVLEDVGHHVGDVRVDFISQQLLDALLEDVSRRAVLAQADVSPGEGLHQLDVGLVFAQELTDSLDRTPLLAGRNHDTHEDHLLRQILGRGLHPGTDILETHPRFAPGDVDRHQNPQGLRVSGAGREVFVHRSPRLGCFSLAQEHFRQPEGCLAIGPVRAKGCTIPLHGLR